jgi:hypothetical protein
MDNINFSNDLFRRMVQAFKPQPINEVEDVQEAVPFKKHAFGEMKLKDTDVKIKEGKLNEVDPQNLKIGKEYVYLGTSPVSGEVDNMYLKYKGIVKDVKGMTYHLFDDGKGTSGIWADNDVKTRFRSPEESMRSSFDSWRNSLEELEFNTDSGDGTGEYDGGDLEAMSDLGL